MTRCPQNHLLTRRELSREIQSLEAAKLHFAAVAKYESWRGYLDPQLVRHAIKLREQLRIATIREFISSFSRLRVSAKHLAQFPVAILFADELRFGLPLLV